jgi:hypothetical protein
VTRLMASFVYDLHLPIADIEAMTVTQATFYLENISKLQKERAA